MSYYDNDPKNINNDQNTQHNYQGYSDPHNYYGYQNDPNSRNYYGGSADPNEFVYDPPRKKSKGRKAVTAVVALLSVAAVAVTSIVGYSLFTGNRPGISDSAESSDTAAAGKNNKKEDTDSKSSVDRDNLPSIIQLATPSDAMTIPDIVEKVSPSVVGISCLTNSGTAVGTGIIMSQDGYIITNAHVVEDAARIQYPSYFPPATIQMRTTIRK